MAEIELNKKNIAESYSKIWIYLPLYLIGLVTSIWLLYSYLNNTPLPEQKIIAATQHKSTISEAFLACYDHGKKVMGGSFGLMPTIKMMPDFEALDEACLDRICQEFKAVENGYASRKEFYAMAARKDPCYLPILNAVLLYHNQILKDQPLLAFFYDSGQYNLSSFQQKKLKNFLEGEAFDSDEYGLLIIGRASKVGEDYTNKKLSRKRAEKIIDFMFDSKINDLESEYVYFGSDPPQLNKTTADKLKIEEKDYEKIRYGNGRDADFSLRLNQSVLLVLYPIKEDPFDLEK